MITIVNYGLGNIAAFSNLYKRLNIPAKVARTAADLADAERIILPGVGAWVYFFAVKLPSGDFRNVNVGGLVHRGPPLDHLRYLAEQTPTLKDLPNFAAVKAALAK